MGFSLNCYFQYMAKVQLFLLLCLSCSLGGSNLVEQGIKERQASSTITVAIPSATDIRDFDTAKITKDYQYTVLLALYSPLLEHDYLQSQIVIGLAESFSWEGNDFVVKIKKDRFTKSGYHITADDVIFTLKRQMILGSNSHGDLRRLFCGGFQIIEVDQDCNGLSKRDNYTIIFHLKQKSPDLIRSLTSIDFGIVPRTAVDPATLKIVDYSETSGPMYFAGKDDKGQIVLAAQPNHWHNLAFEKAVLFPDSYINTNGEAIPASVAAFESGIIDIVPTTSLHSLGPESYRFRFPYFVHTTNHLGISYLRFTKEGRSMPPQIRNYWARQLQNHIASHPERMLPNRKITRQFFIEEGFGGLSPELKRRLDSVQTGELLNPPSFVIAAHEGVYDLYKRLFVDLPLVKILKESDVSVVNAASSAQPQTKIHATVSMIDGSFDEDLNYLEFLYKDGLFPIQDGEGAKWLEAYSSELDESTRDKMVQMLHWEMIAVEPTVVPLWQRPYTAWSRNGWVMTLPKNYVSMPLWLIKRS
jgi:hypothetical protein